MRHINQNSVLHSTNRCLILGVVAGQQAMSGQSVEGACWWQPGLSITRNSVSGPVGMLTLLAAGGSREPAASRSPSLEGACSLGALNTVSGQASRWHFRQRCSVLWIIVPGLTHSMLIAGSALPIVVNTPMPPPTSRHPRAISDRIHRVTVFFLS